MAIKGFAGAFARTAYLTLGALIAAAGLELFLVPNSILDGGVIGVSIIAGHLTGVPLGVLIVALNLPFVIVGYRQIGRSFAISTSYSVVALGVFVTLLHPVDPFTGDLLLATVFGGIVLGIGVGLIIRKGGSLDGTEIVAILGSRKTGFSVGEIVMFFNIFILGSAGFVFTWDRAMYSLIAYFIAFQMIDLVIAGFEESKAVTIITTKGDELAEVILHRLGRGVTKLRGSGGYSGEERDVLYSVITRLEVAKFKNIVQDIDPGAFVAVENVHEVLGGRVAKRAIH